MDSLPVKRTRVVMQEYWDCGNHEHSHQTKSIAKNCIKKQAIARVSMKERLEKVSRNRTIATNILKDEMSIVATAGLHHISVSRCNQVFRKQLARIKIGKEGNEHSARYAYLSEIRANKGEIFDLLVKSWSEINE